MTQYFLPVYIYLYLVFNSYCDYFLIHLLSDFRSFEMISSYENIKKFYLFY